LTTAEGGAVAWTKSFGMTDEDIYKEYMLLSLHGQSKDAFSKMQKGAWEYDIIYPAYKCNMTDILASVGLVQLKRYQNLLKKRFELIKEYESKLISRVRIIKHVKNNSISSAHLLLCNISNISEIERNEIIMKLAEAGISTNVHYKPLPLFTAYKNLGFEISDFPNAFDLYINEITLPLHTSMTIEDVEYICFIFNQILKDY